MLLEIGTEYKKYSEHKALKHHREKNKRWTKRKSFERQKRSQVELSDNLPWKRGLSPLSDMWSQHWKHDFGDNIWWAAQTELCLKYLRNFLFIYKHPTFAFESERECHKIILTKVIFIFLVSTFSEPPRLWRRDVLDCGQAH